MQYIDFVEHNLVWPDDEHVSPAIVATSKKKNVRIITI